MMIDVISTGTILVAMDPGEVRRYGVGADAPEPAAREGLLRLMHRVGEECGLDHSSKSYLIEVLPGGDSALLIITVRDSRRRRLYRIKRAELFPCCRFEKADDLIDYISRATLCSYKVIESFDSLWLIPGAPLSEKQRRELSEYGCLCELSAVALARVCEYGGSVYRRCCPRPIKSPVRRNQ